MTAKLLSAHALRIIAGARALATDYVDTPVHSDDTECAGTGEAAVKASKGTANSAHKHRVWATYVALNATEAGTVPCADCGKKLDLSNPYAVQRAHVVPKRNHGHYCGGNIVLVCGNGKTSKPTACNHNVEYNLQANVRVSAYTLTASETAVIRAEFG